MNGADLRLQRLAGSRPRYQEPWADAFECRLQHALQPGVSILDVGGGRRPSVPPQRRPQGCHYIALDVSARELEAAPAGSYDELVVGDVTDRQPRLAGRFDIVVSWQVLEHVANLTLAIDNIYAYLRPGGCLVAQVSGKYSVHAMVNVVLPHRLVATGQKWLFGRDPHTVFPAKYDRCSYSGLQEALNEWTSVQILPRYRSAGYFAFSGVLQRGYLFYEDWIVDRQFEGLATHYLIFAVR